VTEAALETETLAPRRRRRVVAKPVEAEIPAAVSVTAPPKRVKIVLEENANIPKTGQFFGVNGASYILKPGHVALVPQGLVDVLENAIEHVPVIEEGSLRVVDMRKKYRYPFRILGDA